MKAQPKFSSKQKLALGIFALVTAITVGCGVFVWKDKNRAFYVSYRILKRVNPEKAARLAFEKSEEYRRARNTDKMLALYDEMIEANLADATVLNNRAFWLLGKDDEQAEKYLTQAMAITPLCAECMNNLGTILLKKQPGKAKELFELAAKAKPKYVEPRLNLAVYLENREEWKKALDLYQDALTNTKSEKMREGIQSRMAWMTDIISGSSPDVVPRDISGKRK